MVEIPGVPRGVSTVQAPRTAVSPGEVAAPYQELANNLDKIGEAAGNVAEQQAEAAGHNAVRTDDQGNYVVDKAPYILGPASQSYARAARFEYLGKVTPQIEDKITQMRLDHANDPAGLKAASDEYTKSITGGISDPLLRGPVERVASQAAGHAYRTALVSADTTTRSNALTAMTSQLAMINEQSTALARQEGGCDTPEYARLARDRAALYNELGSDPRFGYPKERIEQELKANRDDDVVQYKIGQIVRKYKTKQDGAEAKQALQDAFWGEGAEKLGLSIHKRDAAVTEGYRALASMTAEEKAGTQENRAMTSEYIQGLKDAPNTFNDIKHNTMLEQAKKFGDDKLVGELNATRTLIPLMQWAKGANEAEGTAMLDAAHKGLFPGIPSMLSKSQQIVSDVIAHAEVVGHGFGIDPATGKPIRTGYDQTVSGQTFNTDEFQGQHPYESGRFRPYVYTSGPHRGEISTASGRGQETLTTYRESARNYGVTGFTPAAQDARTFYKAEDLYKKSDPSSRFPGATGNLEKDVEKFGTDPNFWSRAFAPAAAREWTSVPGGEQPNDSTRTWIANAVRLSSGEGPQIAAGSFTKGVGGFVPGERVASQPIAVQRLFQSTVTSLHSQVSKQAQLSADTIVKTLEKGETLEPNELGDFAQAAAETGQEAELLPKVEAAIRASKGADEAEKAGQITALRAQIEEVKASGVNPIARRVLDETVKMIDLNQKRLKEDPLSAGTLAHEVKSINQIDFTNPPQAAGELSQRDAKLRQMRQLHPEIPQTAPVIGSGEGKVIANALISGPIDQADGFLKAASQSLSPETFHATMASAEMKDALVTMSHSSDPARMAAGMATLDRLWRGNAPDFQGTYGADTLSRMLAFNGLKGSLPPDQIAMRLNRADDPAEAEARYKEGEVIETELRKQQPQAVLNALGTWMQRQWFVPFANAEVNQPLFQAPQGRVILAEYLNQVKALRMYGVPADKAAAAAQEQLRKDWQPSEVAGNRIMKNRPENYYPMINGSHDWMRPALEEDITAALGPRETTVNTAVGPQTSYNWTIKALVPDKQTEAEIAEHRPPSYQVVVTHNGMDEIVRDPSTGHTRFAFDPTPHQEAYNKGFANLDQYRKRVQQLRAMGADTGFPGINMEKPTSILPTPAGLPVTPTIGTRG